MSWADGEVDPNGKYTARKSYIQASLVTAFAGSTAHSIDRTHELLAARGCNGKEEGEKVINRMYSVRATRLSWMPAGPGCNLGLREWNWGFFSFFILGSIIFCFFVLFSERFVSFFCFRSCLFVERERMRMRMQVSRSRGGGVGKISNFECAEGECGLRWFVMGWSLK